MMKIVRSSLCVFVVVILSLCLLAVTTRINNTVTRIPSYSSYSKNGTANTSTRALNGTPVSTTTFSSSSSSAVELEPQQEPPPPPPPTCRRPCPPGKHYYNKIIYHNWLPTGLNDRLTVISELSNLAGWLCAVVEFPPPSYALAHKHNHPRPHFSDQELNTKRQQQQQQEQQPNFLSPDLQWSDFINLSFLDGPTTTSQVVVNLDMALGVSPQQGKHQRSVSPNRLRFYQGGPYKDWNHIMTKDPHTIVQNVEQLNGIVQRQYHEALLLPQQNGHFNNGTTTTTTTTTSNHNSINNTEPYFIWTIKSNWYDALPVLREWMEGQQQFTTTFSAAADSFPRLSRKGTGCDYVQGSSPLYQLELVDEVLHHVASLSSSRGPPSRITTTTTTTTTAMTSNTKNRKELLGFLHVRRGDQQSRDECNTELDRVQQYIDCSFSGMDQVIVRTTQNQQEPQHLHITLLFASDEENVTYRHAIRTMVLRQQELYNTTTTSSSSLALALEFVDLDNLLWQLLDLHIQQGRLPSRLANNFVIFQMEWILQWEENHVDFRLQQRRGMACPSCDNGWIYSLY